MGVTCSAGEAFAGAGAFVCWGKAGFGSQFGALRRLGGACARESQGDGETHGQLAKRHSHHVALPEIILILVER